MPICERVGFFNDSPAEVVLVFQDEICFNLRFKINKCQKVVQMNLFSLLLPLLLKATIIQPNLYEQLGLSNCGSTVLYINSFNIVPFKPSTNGYVSIGISVDFGLNKFLVNPVAKIDATDELGTSVFQNPS